MYLNTQKKKKHIYIPIEVVQREFNHKLLLAIKAALKGYRVYFGTKSGLGKVLETNKNEISQKGILFYKSFALLPNSQFGKLYKLFEHFIVFDEELGPSIKNIDLSIKQRLKINQASIFFVIGKQFKKKIKMLNNEFYKKTKIIVSGWPKFDLFTKKYLKIYQKDIEKIREKYGNFYLFSSNFGFINEKLFKKKIKDLKKIKNKNLKKQNISLIKNGYNDFNNLIFELNNLKNKINSNLIIRPHPADKNHEDWEDKLINNPNIKIKSNNEIIPWIIASKGLLHRGCSTSIDSYLLKKKIFYVLPNRTLKKNEKNLSYNLSLKIKKIETILNGDSKFIPHKKRINSNFIQNVKKKNSIDIILNSLNKLKCKTQRPIKMNFFIKAWRKLTFESIYFLLKFKLKKKNPYTQKQVYDFSNYNLKNKISIFSNNKKIKIKYLLHDVVEIEHLSDKY